jgi:hypothetical protein
MAGYHIHFVSTVGRLSSYLTECSEIESVLINRHRHRHGGLESTSSTASAVYS